MSSELFDNRSLIPRDSSLQQQASIDWTRLGGSTISFTVEFLARLSNGGIEGLTIFAAETVLSQLKLGPTGEKRALDAVDRLKAFSSINNALWFGFGVKHVIRQLAESSEGLNCIAVCSALLEFYSADDTAKILRDILESYSPPQRLKPSLRQWRSLVEACGGAFATTDFGILIHTISSLNLSDGRSELRCRADTHDIAAALNKVIAVSNGSLERVHFVGGADCGWLAAFSIWVLDLTVVVQDGSGNAVYRFPEELKDPKVIITYNDFADSMQLVRQATAVPRGRVFLREPHNRTGFLREGSMEYDNLLSYGRVSWTSLFRDTFGKPVGDLLDGGLTTTFGIALGCIARIFTAVLENDPGLHKKIQNLYRKYWKYVNSSSHGRGFINIIRQHLPELAQSERLIEATERGLAAEYIDAVAMYEQSMQLIAAKCRCSICTNHSGTQSSSKRVANSVFCQLILVEMTSELVQIISSIVPPIPTLPTRAGLENFYWSRVSSKRGKGNYLDHLLSQGDRSILDSAKCLFTGRGRASRPMGRLPSTSMLAGRSALISQGLCFFLEMLVSLSANQDQCRAIRIMSGCIEWYENLYDEISDLPLEEPRAEGPQYEASIGRIMSSTSCMDLQDSASPDLEYDLLIEESSTEGAAKALQVAYRFKRANNRRFLLGPSQTAQELGPALSGKDCKGQECGVIPPFDILPVYGEGFLLNKGNIPEIDSIPLVVALPKSVPAQLVALSHGIILQDPDNPVTDPQLHVIPKLQDRECLSCLLNSAAKGPDTMNTRVLCILTS